MSEKKRRKISDPKEDIFLYRYRKDFINDFIPTRMIVRNIFPVVGFWESLKSDEEKIKEVLRHVGVQKLDEKNVLFKIMSRKSATELRIFFSKYFELNNVSKSFNKKTYILELLHKFMGLPSPHEQRKIEGENLSFVRDFDFLTMCNILIPNEIVKKILSHFRRDSKILYSLGKVCKSFYITILSTWDYVHVRSQNVISISLLVLKNVKGVSIHHSLDNKELAHVWRNLNHTVEKISVDCSLRKSSSSSKVKNEPERLKKLRTEFQKRISNSIQRFFKSDKTNDFTPRLKILNSFNGTIMNDLMMNFPNVEELLCMWNFNDSVFLDRLSNLKKLRVLDVDFSRFRYTPALLNGRCYPSVKKLSFMFVRWYNLYPVINQVDFASIFPNCEWLRMQLTNMYRQGHRRNTPKPGAEVFQFARKFQNIKKVELIERNSDGKDSNHTTVGGNIAYRRDIPFPLSIEGVSGLKLEKLYLTSNCSPHVFWSTIDSNLEVLLSSRFFEKNKINKFDVVIPLGLRTRIFDSSSVEVVDEKERKGKMKEEMKIIHSFFECLQKGVFDHCEESRWCIFGRNPGYYNRMHKKSRFIYYSERVVCNVNNSSTSFTRRRYQIKFSGTSRIENLESLDNEQQQQRGSSDDNLGNDNDDGYDMKLLGLFGEPTIVMLILFLPIFWKIVKKNVCGEYDEEEEESEEETDERFEKVKSILDELKDGRRIEEVNGKKKLGLWQSIRWLVNHTHHEELKEGGIDLDVNDNKWRFEKGKLTAIPNRHFRWYTIKGFVDEKR